YTANVIRSLPREDGIPNGLRDYIVVSAIKKFMDEPEEQRPKELSLGFMPLFRTTENEHFKKYSKVAKSIFTHVYEYGNSMFHWKELAHHKRFYNPEERFVYAGYPTGSLSEVLGSFQVCRVIPNLHEIRMKDVHTLCKLLQPHLSQAKNTV